MADKNKKGNPKGEELYQWISGDLQGVKNALIAELKVSAAQVASMYENVKTANAAASGAIAQEIRYGYKQNQNIYEGVASLVKSEVAERLNAMDEKMTSLQQLEEILTEIADLKYSYMQLQAICEGLSSVVSNDVVPQLNSLAEMGTKLETIDAALEALNAQLADVASLSEEDVKKIVDESLAVHSQQILDAVAAIPAAENVDYVRITEEVSERVIESLPYVEAVDYNRINASIATAVASAINVDAIAEAVAAKISIPEPAAVEAPTVDYDKLADLVVEKLAAKGISADVILDEAGIDKIAETVAEKVAPAEQAEAVDYNRVAEIVEEKVNKGCDNFERVVTLDDEGIQKIVDGVAEELRNMTLVCEYEEIDNAEPVEEEVVVEEAVEEVAEEVVEEAPVEEEAPAEEATEEIAVATAEPVYEELDGELIDAETGLVVRLKRSFTAKMKQSDEKVKANYSDIKNELISYKRINSNVSWHGDRFNFGRDTVAKIGINGKTLCFYLALDPNDPELKQTVYHQKDVGAQKAYESTPFMVKVKSDAALKKALRLVAILAEKLGTEKDEKYEPVDYVAEFAYESTKSLFESGYIKATKEKKVDFNF